MTNDDILNSIISLLAVDGKISKHETRFFDEVCERLNVSTEQKNAAIMRVEQGKGSIHLESSNVIKK